MTVVQIFNKDVVQVNREGEVLLDTGGDRGADPGGGPVVRTLDLEDTIASPVVRHRVLVSLIKARALLKIVRIPHARLVK